VDETGIEQHNSSEYGYALRGEKIYEKVHGKRYARTNIVAGKQGDKIIGATEFNGTMKAARFETWFLLIFLPLLVAGTVIVMDNAKFHRKIQLRALVALQGCKIIFLPKYSPDLNPIEKLWANLKYFLKHSLHTFKSLGCAIAKYFQLG